MNTEVTIREALPKPAEDQQPCWHCSLAVTNGLHFCPHCQKVQPAGPVDYFTFLSLPRKLNIDIAALEREFYRLSRKLHPDVFARASTTEQQWSLDKSSLLNDAYRTLKEPIARTQYLLELEGVKLEEQSRAATDKAQAEGRPKEQVVPPDLLEEVFELNMQLEELRMNKKMGEEDPGNVHDLQAAQKKFEASLEDSTNELKSLWNDWDKVVDGANSGDSELRTAVRDKMVAVLNRRSYLRNLVRDVSEALAN